MKRIFKGLDDLLRYFKDTLDVKVKIDEMARKEVDTSSESRIQTDYEVKLLDEKIIGHYKNIEFYKKDRKTMIAEFGMLLE